VTVRGLKPLVSGDRDGVVGDLSQLFLGKCELGALQLHDEMLSAVEGEAGFGQHEIDDPCAAADELNKQLEQARAAEEAEYVKLVEQTVTSGKLPSGNGHGRWAYDSPASKLVVAGVAVCHQKANAAASNAGPALFAALQGRVAAVVEESAKLAATVPPWVVDETSALHAGNGDTKHRTTWRKLRALVDDWVSSFELLAVMQRAGWVDGPTHPRDRDGAVVFQRYLRPLSLPPGYWKGPGELRLATAAASNAAPAMYPWQDALERWLRIDRRQRNWGAMEVVQTHDSMGNVIAERRSPETPGEFAPAAGVS